MTDKTIPAGLTRDEARAVREWAERARSAEVQDETMYHAARVLLAVLPKRPTLADMTEEERRACKWMQADVAGHGTRYVIANPDDDGNEAELVSAEGEIAWIFPEYVTPRPDLPRLEWPSDQEPAPAPALPDGWRLADHKDHGRVIVTTPTPDVNGEFVIIRPHPHRITRTDTSWCDPAELTYIDADQDAGIPDTVPPNTLAVGSVWGKTDALARACKESERDQIIALDRDGDAYIWSEAAEWWEGSGPLSKDAPYTIIHEGKKAHQ